MRTTTSPSGARIARPLVLLGLLVVAATSIFTLQVEADDRDLLRDNSSQPYLFLLLDSSLSMTTTIDGDWLPAGADDPRSKMYQVKEVLYDVLKNISGIRYGFATYNQDQIRLTRKHFLYFVKDLPDNTNEIGNFPFMTVTYPAVEPGDEVEVTAATGGVDVEIDGDMMTFGAPVTTTAGDCANPLNLNDSDEREAFNRFPKLGIDGSVPTTIYVTERGRPNDPVYAVTFSRTLSTAALGDADLKVDIEWQQVDQSMGCTATAGTSPKTGTLEFGLWTDFLFAEAADGGFDIGTVAENVGTGYWDGTDIEGHYDCGTKKPFSGRGWEGNYDTEDPSPPPPPPPPSTLYDKYCVGTSCVNLQHPTVTASSPAAPELDQGDVLPLHWNFDNKTELLTRLNPKHGTGDEDFGVASYFQNQPNSAGFLELNNSLELPIVAAGVSPVGGSALDYRCWWRGGPNDRKCKAEQHELYPTGFQELLRINDPGAFQCRKPYLIIISDFEETCPNSDDVSKIAGMNALTGGRAGGVDTWALLVGTANVQGIVSAGNGQLVTVGTKQVLRSELQRILGIIQETSRAFASAAVPSVQADVEDRIFLTQFTPAQGETVWPGQAQAFRKPLPFDLSDPNNPIPDVTHTNFLWDGAVELMSQAPPSPPAPTLGNPNPTLISLPTSRLGLQLGTAIDERRPLYAMENAAAGLSSGAVPRYREVFGPVEGTPPPTLTLNDVREDQWRGLGIIGAGTSLNFTGIGNTIADVDGSIFQSELHQAHLVYREAYEPRVTEITDPTTGATSTIEYVLGDVFHSDPQVVGAPSIGLYLSNPDNFPGYQEYFDVYQRRRKILLFGSNDGFLHAFDAGRFTLNAQRVCSVSGSPCGSGAGGAGCSATEVCTLRDAGEFNAGTGRELFAYVPRALMPGMRDRAVDNVHIWGVDAAITVSDVFIDPVHDGLGSLNPPNAAEREWRTVVVSGLRRGGSGYFALDLTQPDGVQREVETLAGVELEQGYVPTNSNPIPSCLAQTGTGTTRIDHDSNPLTAPIVSVADCHPNHRMRYPAALWEFEDDSDLDGNTELDLAESWSKPNIGAIRVNVGTNVETRFVAVFGGGISSSSGLTVDAGNWLYMVDIETGELIYKRQLDGPAASGPAAVDTNLDGFLDRIYIGTTTGFLYRADIGDPKNLASCPLSNSNLCVTDSAWEPYKIFDTVTSETDSTTGNTIQVRKPIFLRPSVFFAPEVSRYGVAFGTGNRENLWVRSQDGGNRFYVLIDDSDDLVGAQKLRTQANFTTVGTANANQDFLQNSSLLPGNRGWVYEMGQTHVDDPTVATNDIFDPGDERLLVQPLAISGLLNFATYLPYFAVSQSGSGNNSSLTCARTGVSRSYLVLTESGDAVFGDDADNSGILDPGEEGERSQVVEGLVSTAFLQRSSTANAGTGGNFDPCAGTDILTNTLKTKIFPPNCTFASFGEDISYRRDDTGIECVARIPVCIIERNWKEF